GSGLDRALEEALHLGLDETLETGEIWPGERKRFPDPVGKYDPAARPWQRPLAEPRHPPAADEPLFGMLLRSSRGDEGSSARPREEEPDGTGRRIQDAMPPATTSDEVPDQRPHPRDERLLITFSRILAFIAKWLIGATRNSRLAAPSS